MAAILEVENQIRVLICGYAHLISINDHTTQHEAQRKLASIMTSFSGHLTRLKSDIYIYNLYMIYGAKLVMLLERISFCCGERRRRRSNKSRELARLLRNLVQLYPLTLALAPLPSPS